MMTMYLCVLALVTAAACLVAAGFTRRRGVSRQQLRQAAEGCGQMLRLLALLQQHRGASAAWLAGDAAFGERMRTLQREIEQLWPPINEIARRESDALRPCFTLNDWTMFQFKWRELLERLPYFSVEQGVLAHTQMITRLLDWLAALGEARIEVPAGAHLPTGMVRDFSHRLPALAECLGQARAIGAAAAAAGLCPPVTRVRLGFLVTRAESLLAATRRADRPRTADAAQRAVEDLLGVIRQHVLGGARVSIGAQEYFATATRAVDAVFAWIASYGDVLLQGGDVPVAQRTRESARDGWKAAA